MTSLFLLPWIIFISIRGTLIARMRLFWGTYNFFYTRCKVRTREKRKNDRHCTEIQDCMLNACTIYIHTYIDYEIKTCKNVSGYGVVSLSIDAKLSFSLPRLPICLPEHEFLWFSPSLSFSRTKSPLSRFFWSKAGIPILDDIQHVTGWQMITRKATKHFA